MSVYTVAVLLLCPLLVLGYGDTVLFRSKIDSNEVSTHEISGALGEYLNMNASYFRILSVVSDVDDVVVRVRCLGSGSESAVLLTQRLVTSLGSSALLRAKLSIAEEVPLVCMDTVNGVTCGSMPDCSTFKEPVGIILLVALACSLFALLWVVLLFISSNTPAPASTATPARSSPSSSHPSVNITTSTASPPCPPSPPGPEPLPEEPKEQQDKESLKSKHRRKRAKPPVVKIFQQPTAGSVSAACKTKVPVQPQSEPHDVPALVTPPASPADPKVEKVVKVPDEPVKTCSETAIQTTPQEEMSSRGVSGGTVVSTETGTLPPQPHRMDPSQQIVLQVAAQQQPKLKPQLQPQLQPLAQPQFSESNHHVQRPPQYQQHGYHLDHVPQQLHMQVQEQVVRDFSYIPDHIDSPELGHGYGPEHRYEYGHGHGHGYGHDDGYEMYPHDGQPLQPIIDMATTPDSQEYFPERDRHHAGPVTPRNKPRHRSQFTSPNYNDSDGEQDVSDLTPLSGRRHRTHDDEGYYGTRGHPLQYPQNGRKSFTKRYEM